MSKRTNIFSLTDDIMFFDILVRVPAQDVHAAAKLVCRKWYQMICTHDFKRAHFKKSAPGFFIQEVTHHGEFDQSTFFAVRGKGQIETYKLSYDLKDLVPASCNGLILELHNNKGFFHITNPATVQRFALPLISAKTEPLCMAVAYAATSMVYKVVCTYHNLECAILSVGVDKDWRRRVSTNHLSLTAKELFKVGPLTTDGFLHWAKNGTCLGQPQFVLTLNVETEIITQIPVPWDGRKLNYFYFEMGSSLSLLVTESYRLWEVWEMRPENGEWTHTLDFNLGPEQVMSFKLKQIFHSSTCFLEPVPRGWSIFREVLLFRVFCTSRGSYIAYNVRTREIDSFEVDSSSNCVFAHKNSLLWLDDHC